MSNLHSEIGSLSAAEKCDLLDFVWQSLETESLALTHEQRAELNHRTARYENNLSDVIPWENIKGRLFKKQ